MSFRPLTGIVVLIKKAAKQTFVWLCTSFRPLTGIVILIDYGKYTKGEIA